MRAQRRTPEEQLEMVRLCRASGLTIVGIGLNRLKESGVYAPADRIERENTLEPAAA